MVPKTKLQNQSGILKIWDQGGQNTNLDQVKLIDMDLLSRHSIWNVLVFGIVLKQTLVVQPKPAVNIGSD